MYIIQIFLIITIAKCKNYLFFYIICVKCKNKGMRMKKNLYLTNSQFADEIKKCLQCPSKPCQKVCPANCSPCDFIKEAKNGNLPNAARAIYEQNVLGETCGLICPSYLCMKACVRAKIDKAINIPEIQAYIMQQAASELANFFIDKTTKSNGKKVAVVGLGPAGIGATAELLKQGFSVDAYEKADIAGGALNLIPDYRLPHKILAKEWQILAQSSLLTVYFNYDIEDYTVLLDKGYCAVIIATGEQKPRALHIKGDELAINYSQYLQNPTLYKAKQKIAVIGGGLVAVDCAVTACISGAAEVEMFVRRGFNDMRITEFERETLLEKNVNINAMTRVAEIKKNNGLLDLYLLKTKFDENGKLVDDGSVKTIKQKFDLVIYALGNERSEELKIRDKFFYAGDLVNGSSTAVQALASGKQAALYLCAHI